MDSPNQIPLSSEILELGESIKLPINLTQSLSFCDKALQIERPCLLIELLEALVHSEPNILSHDALTADLGVGLHQCLAA